MSASHLRTVYVAISKKPVSTSRAIINDKVYVDYDEDGKVVGFEFFGPTDVICNRELPDVEE